MADKAFMQIKQAESQAQALMENAQAEAARIVTRAQEENTEALARLAETCGQQIQESKQQAQANAQAASAAFAGETMRQCAALMEKLLSQKPKAVDAVIQQAAGRG